MANTPPSKEAGPMVLELIQGLHQYLLTVQTKSESGISRIIDVADESQEASIRKVAIPSPQGRPLEDSINQAVEIFSHRVAMDHPRFFGFIPSPVHPVAYLGDIITIMFNTHAGSWFQSSGPSAIEDVLLEWLGQQAGMPSSVGGIFVSGGSVAKLSAIVMARDQKLSFDQRRRGIIYLSDQTHSSVKKGLAIAGFHETQMRWIKSDEAYRISVLDLSETIAADREAGLLPFLLIATCGYTNTGAVDPLQDLADIAEHEKLWLHVDGAYGASVLLSQQHKRQADGIGRAHSLSWDAHKWLFQTYACGMLLVREKRNLVQTFATNASYIQDADEMSSAHVNFWNRGVELTRPARAMKLWFTLQVLGLDKMGEMIGHGIHLAEYAEQMFSKMPDWEIVTPAKLAIINFRYLPPYLKDHQSDPRHETELERLNIEISRRAIAENVAAPLTTRLHGRLNMRICSIHPSLSEVQMGEIIQNLDIIARKTSRDMEAQASQEKKKNVA